MSHGEINGIVMSGALIHGQYIQSGTVYPYPTGAALASGNVQSGHVASGAVPGYFGPTRAIQSGSVGSFDFGSGAVMAGQIGSGAVQSGNIASGSISANHTVSGTIYGVPSAASLASGDVQSGHIGSGAVGGYRAPTRHIQSGTIGGFDFSSGAITSSVVIGSGAIIGTIGIVPYHIASGSIGPGNMGNNSVRSGNIAAGQIGGDHLSSGIDLVTNQVIKWFDAVELISGLKAVSYASGGPPRIQRAEVRSGWRSPTIGVTMSGAVSGGSCAVVIQGPVYSTASGMITSGNHGAQMFAGSGGLIVVASGNFHGGASSGGGARSTVVSGRVVMLVGMSISGGIDVRPDHQVMSLSGQMISRIGFVV